MPRPRHLPHLPSRASRGVLARSLVAAGTVLTGVAGLAVTGVAAATWAAPAAPGERAGTGGSDGSVVRYFREGPGEQCGSDFCGIGVVEPVRVRVPSGRHAMLVTTSFQYRTSTGDGAALQVGVRREGGERVAVRPGTRYLAPSTAPTSTTSVSLVRDLQPGATYLVLPGVRLHDAAGERSRVSTAKVLLEVRFR